MTQLADALVHQLAKLTSAAHVNRGVINLTPSENRLSPLAQIPLTTDFYNRYFFNDHKDPTFWEFRGGEGVADFEADVAMPALCRLADTSIVNLRPLSGLSAMLLVISGLGGPKSSGIVCVSRETGGHVATPSLIRRLGYEPLPVALRDGVFDDRELKNALCHHDVSLVYVDLQNTLAIPDYESIACQVHDVRTDVTLHVDVSHVLGLVLGNAHPNPVASGADSLGGSTHKSFPGPQKGVLFTNHEGVADDLFAAQFDLISSHHFAETLSLGLAALEFEQFGRDYAPRVVELARLLAVGLSERGFRVAKGSQCFTDNHQVWLDVGTAEDVNAITATLAEGGIRANWQGFLPGLPGPGVRLGTNEIAFEGANADSISLLVEYIERSRDGRLVPDAAARVRETFGSPFFYRPEDVEGALAALVDGHLVDPTS